MPKVDFKTREAEVIDGIEFGQRTYKSVGPVNYYMPGIASTSDKKVLNDWIKKTKGGGVPPLPWKSGYRSSYSGICVDEFPDTEDIVEEVIPSIQSLTDEDISKIVEPLQVLPATPSLPTIFNIKSVPDDRRRTGYRTYPRL
jgi:hypothetical protein